MKSDNIPLSSWPEDPAWPDPFSGDPYDIQARRPADSARKPGLTAGFFCTFVLIGLKFPNLLR